MCEMITCKLSSHCLEVISTWESFLFFCCHCRQFLGQLRGKVPASIDTWWSSLFFVVADSSWVSWEGSCLTLLTRGNRLCFFVVIADSSWVSWEGTCLPLFHLLSPPNSRTAVGQEGTPWDFNHKLIVISFEMDQQSTLVFFSNLTFVKHECKAWCKWWSVVYQCPMEGNGLH